MDNFKRAFYEVKYTADFLGKNADEFQGFFSSIMEKRYPGDFIRVRPWGRMGDRKNDGYLRSKRTLFQVYAPNELSSSVCVAKIQDDFSGALPYWSDFFDNWIFVHNSKDGLGPEVTRKLLELDSTYPQINIFPWGFEELRREIMGLSDPDLESLLGPSPSIHDMISLGLSDLMPILDHITCFPPNLDPDIRPVPADKIQRNMLSDAVASLLRVGMGRADLVRKYFKMKPSLQDKIAENFRAKYIQLRGMCASPDEIFTSLQRFSGGDIVPSPKMQGAILACLAFFFEECDIYENPEVNEGDIQ